MCLIVKQGTRIKIAKEDLHVFKMLYGELESPALTGFIYTQDKLYETKIQKSRDFNCMDEFDRKALLKLFPSWANGVGVDSYGAGFHSMLKNEKKRLWGTGFYMYNVIIPKGSKYMVNPSGLIISNKIK